MECSSWKTKLQEAAPEAAQGLLRRMYQLKLGNRAKTCQTWKGARAVHLNQKKGVQAISCWIRFYERAQPGQTSQPSCTRQRERPKQQSELWRPAHRCPRGVGAAEVRDIAASAPSATLPASHKATPPRAQAATCSCLQPPPRGLGLTFWREWRLLAFCSFCILSFPFCVTMSNHFQVLFFNLAHNSRLYALMFNYTQVTSFQLGRGRASAPTPLYIKKGKSHTTSGWLPLPLEISRGWVET